MEDLPHLIHLTVNVLTSESFFLPDSNKTICSIKKAIHERINIDIGRQILISEGKKLDDSKTIDDYGYNTDSIFSLCVEQEHNCTVFVKSIDSIMTFAVADKDTIHDLKSAIYGKNGLQPADQILKYHSDEIELKDEETISDIKNQNNSYLFLNLSSYSDMVVDVIILNRKRITVVIKPFFTVFCLKRIINVRECIPPDQQLLIFGGNELEDSKPLCHYNIFNGSTL